MRDGLPKRAGLPMRADEVPVRLEMPVQADEARDGLFVLFARAAALRFNGAAGRGLIAASADAGNVGSTITGTSDVAKCGSTGVVEGDGGGACCGSSLGADAEGAISKSVCQTILFDSVTSAGSDTTPQAHVNSNTSVLSVVSASASAPPGCGVGRLATASAESCTAASADDGIASVDGDAATS